MNYSETTTSLSALLQTSCDKDATADFWNIDDILAEEELIPCQFLKKARGLTSFSQTHQASKKKKQNGAKLNNRVLPVGAKEDLPLWLAVGLGQRDIVELKKPLFLTRNFFDKLKAGSEVVSINNQTPYVYEAVLKLLDLYPVEDDKDPSLDLPFMI